MTSAKSREEEVLQERYAELVSTLSRSLPEILRGLVSKRVINITDKNNIKQQGGMPEDRAEYLLDHHIERSLASGQNDSLMKLLQVMKEIPQCDPLAVSIEQDLTGAPTVATVSTTGGDDEDSTEEEKVINHRLKHMTSMHVQEEIDQLHEESDDDVCLQQPEPDSQMDIFTKTVKWQEFTSLPVCRTGHTAVMLGGNVYVGGGHEGICDNNRQDCYRLDVYNLTTDQWSSSPITTPYCWFAMTVLDDKLIIAGGMTKNGEIVKKVLVLNAGQWKDYSEMPTARYCTTAVGYHSMLIVVGGVRIKMESELTRLSTIELLDTANGCWYTCNNLPSPRQQLQAVIMNDRLYLLGGFDKDRKPSQRMFVASLDTLSTHQLSWQPASNNPWCYVTAVVLHNSLVTVGGFHASHTSEVNVFNPSTGHWKCFTKIPSARNLPAVACVAEKLIVMGGLTSAAQYSNTVWVGVLE